MDFDIKNYKIAMIGLGYVGLPLAAAFGKKCDVIGYDVNVARVEELKAGKDHTEEVSEEELALATGLSCTADEADLADANVYILALPTPVNEFNVPDFDPLDKRK